MTGKCNNQKYMQKLYKEIDILALAWLQIMTQIEQLYWVPRIHYWRLQMHYKNSLKYLEFALKIKTSISFTRAWIWRAQKSRSEMQQRRRSRSGSDWCIGGISGSTWANKKQGSSRGRRCPIVNCVENKNSGHSYSQRYKYHNIFQLIQHFNFRKK